MPILVLLLMSIITTIPILQNAFAQKFVIEKEDDGFHRAIVETDDRKYKIDADADQFDSDLPGGGFETIIIKNTDAQGAKSFKLETGENADRFQMP